MKITHPQIAIILAAGKGTRMGSSKPKVLHTVLGVPMIVRVTQSALDAGMERVVIVVGHEAEAVIRTVQKHIKSDVISWALQEEQRGTADAVMSARRELGNLNGDVWIISGDTPNLSAQLMLDLKKPSEDCKMLVVGAEMDQYSYMCGRLLRDQKGNLCAIREARDCSHEEREVKEVNAGLYRVNAKLLFEALDTVGTDNAQGEYYLTDMVEYAYRKKIKIFCPILRGGAVRELQGVNTAVELTKAEDYARLLISL